MLPPLCLVFMVCIVLTAADTIRKSDQYVCDQFLDYYTPRTLNGRCQYNPDVGDTTSSIIARHGYRVNQYEVETKDGYILSVIRLSNPQRMSKDSGVVFLQHGFPLSSVDWVNKGKRHSLGLMLADQGFDVWLGNSRGTTLSFSHKNLTSSDNKYWDYSFHEIGLYDLPAMVSLAKKVTGANKIIYVSHSGGSTAALVYASLLKDHAKDTVSLFITMASDSFLAYPKFPVWILYPLPLPLQILAALFKEINLQKALSFVVHTTARYNPLLLIAALDAFQYTPRQKYPPWLPLVASSFPQGANTKQLIHFIQAARVKRFQQFDYGLESNKKIYGSKQPPAYPLSEINVPFLIVYGEKDGLFGPKDAYLLYDHLKGVARKYKPHNAGYVNHFDFVYGGHSNELYRWILKTIKSFRESVATVTPAAVGSKDLIFPK